MAACCWSTEGQARSEDDKPCKREDIAGKEQTRRSGQHASGVRPNWQRRVREKMVSGAPGGEPNAYAERVRCGALRTQLDFRIEVKSS